MSSWFSCGSFRQNKPPVETRIRMRNTVKNAALRLHGHIALAVRQCRGGHADRFDRFVLKGHGDEVGVGGEAFEFAGFVEGCAVVGGFDSYVDFAFSLGA